MQHQHRPYEHEFGRLRPYTTLFEKSTDDMDGSSQSNGTSKSVNKGSTQKKKSTKQASSGTKKNKSSIKSTATMKKKKKKKSVVEISAQSLSPSQQSEVTTTSSDEQKEELQEKNEDDVNYTYNIPKTGYSLADQLENKSVENRERFETTLTPIVTGIESGGMTFGSDDATGEAAEVGFQYDEDGFPIGFTEINKEDESSTDDEKEKEGSSVKKHQGVARIDTISTLGNVGEEPVRWVVSLGDTDNDEDLDSDGGGDGSNTKSIVESFAMIDLPPYSDQLADEIRYFMDPTFNVTTSDADVEIKKKSASLDVILLTNQQCIHYDTSPGVYVTRKSDLTKWKNAFPDAKVVMYRLDIPRECREEVTQVLDGYGPWGWNGESTEFVETGRPLRIEEWDDDTKSRVLTQGELPPDDQDVMEDNGEDDSEDEDELYSTEAIRQREQKYPLLAVYTPGHTFGSVTYIFPKRGICCSGYTLPLESSLDTTTPSAADYDDDNENEIGRSTRSSSFAPPQGPRLDYQGYLATSASRPRQMSSASTLINNYIDRFRVVLPARGDVVFLDTNMEIRKRELMESVGLYQKIGDIYGRLGIVE
jgi:glyoxylase-like metal-dependent hydrolase (beta-lactamase superfamily II)